MSQDTMNNFFEDEGYEGGIDSGRSGSTEGKGMGRDGGE